MTRHEKVGLEAIRAVLIPLGFTVEFEGRSKHHAARVVDAQGAVFRLTLTGSGRTGDHEAASYARQNAQRFHRGYLDVFATADAVEPPAETATTFYVVKDRKRYSICAHGTGETVYTVPDVLSGHVRNRQGLNALAAKMTGGPRDARHIAAFELTLRPN